MAEDSLHFPCRLATAHYTAYVFRRHLRRS
jgi:hypothetical protein